MSDASKQYEAVQNINAAFSSGKFFKYDHMRLFQSMLNQIPSSPPFPNYRRYYLYGYIDALMRQLDNEMEFRYQLPDGSWVNAKDLVYANDCRDRSNCSHTGHIVATRNCPSGYFWRNTDAPYSGAGVQTHDTHTR